MATSSHSRFRDIIRGKAGCSALRASAFGFVPALVCGADRLVFGLSQPSVALEIDTEDLEPFPVPVVLETEIDTGRWLSVKLAH